MNLKTLLTRSGKENSDEYSLGSCFYPLAGIKRIDPTCANCKNWDGNTYHQYGDCQLPGPVKITKHRSEKCGEWEKK